MTRLFATIIFLSLCQLLTSTYHFNTLPSITYLVLYGAASATEFGQALSGIIVTILCSGNNCQVIQQMAVCAILFVAGFASLIFAELLRCTNACAIMYFSAHNTAIEHFFLLRSQKMFFLTSNESKLVSVILTYVVSLGVLFACVLIIIDYLSNVIEQNVATAVIRKLDQEYDLPDVSAEKLITTPPDAFLNEKKRV